MYMAQMLSINFSKDMNSTLFAVLIKLLSKDINFFIKEPY